MMSNMNISNDGVNSAAINNENPVQQSEELQEKSSASIFDELDKDGSGDLSLDELLNDKEITNKYRMGLIKTLYDKVIRDYGALTKDVYIKLEQDLKCFGQNFHSWYTDLSAAINSDRKGNFEEVAEQNRLNNNIHELDVNQDGKVDTEEMGLEEQVSYIEQNLPKIKDPELRFNLELQYNREMEVCAQFTGKEEASNAASGIKTIGSHKIEQHIAKINSLREQIELALQNETLSEEVNE